jgi:hypothetical protein
MRLVGRSRMLWLVAVGLWTGCFEAAPENRAQTVCTEYCECFADPGEVDECIVECVPDIPPVSDECLDCVLANSNSCPALEAQCTDLCVGQQP